MRYQIIDCTGDDDDVILQGLVRYNVEQVPPTQEPGFVNINKKIVDENGDIIAGCLAEMYFWNILYISILWVDERFRHQGLGSGLLREMEAIARRERCTLIHLDTFDFQAKDFYLRHGFELFGVLEDCPPGHCRYYLKKNLAP